jgi:hypothetical protein
VYSRLAPNLLPELKKMASKAERKAHLHRWLTQDIGYPKLREHLASLATLQKLANNAKEWRQLVDRIHPRYGDTIPLPLEDHDNPGREAWLLFLPPSCCRLLRNL